VFPVFDDVFLGGAFGESERSLIGGKDDLDWPAVGKQQRGKVCTAADRAQFTNS
jgi:hypothetical protein